MSHQIIEAIIVDGQIKYANKKLPPGKMKVHLIYDAEENLAETDVAKIVAETSGIYKDINVEAESGKLRLDWERNVNN
ncbi:MAG: hypothetical protein U9R17_19135 [Thermodesulfobacteriota bacterium]|nr:hypothetical protein [Thermodesulfobacteriota bacterium]